MVQKKLELKGSYKGVKKGVEMKKFDITHSTIQSLGKKCYQPKKLMTYLINQLSIKKNENSDTYYIYHMFNALDDDYKIYHSGRWYNGSFELNKKSMNEKDKTIQTKMTFEDEETFKEYKVEIKIYFNESGWKKINSYISL